MYTILDFKIPKPGIKFIYQRNYKNFNPGKFLQEIALSTNISCIFYIDNVDTVWQTFYYEFLRICNKHAPLYKHLIKYSHNPWITNKVKILMRERDFWHNRATKSKNHFDMRTYRKLRKKVTLQIQNEKNISFLPILTKVEVSLERPGRC